MRYLKRLGWRIVERNWRIAAGEIDIVALHRGKIVFVEVKTRTSTALSSQYLFDAVTYEKEERVSYLTRAYLRAKLPKDFDAPYRIDLVGVEIQKSTFQLLRLQHIRGAF